MVPGIYAPQLTERTPRNVKVTAGSKASRALLYLCFLVIPSLFLAIPFLGVTFDRALLDHGKTTQARVTRKYVTVKKDSTDWNLNFKYTVNKTGYTGRAWVSKQRYDATKIGSHLLITYLPANPWTSRLGIVTQKTVRDDRPPIVEVTLIFGPFFLLVVVCKEIAVRNQVRLLRDGTAGQAIVASKQTLGGWSWNSPSRYYVTCNFYTGQQPTSKEFSVPQALYNAVDMGSTLTVLYLPNDPQTSLLYQAMSDAVLR